MSNQIKKNSNLSLVHKVASVKIVKSANVAKDEILAVIAELGDISQLQDDTAFVHYVCNLFENLTDPLTG